MPRPTLLEVHDHMSRSFVPVALAMLAAATLPLLARADPYGDLLKIRSAFESARSWHASEQFSNGRTILIDYVAPNRWRIQPTSNVTEILIGNTVYMVSNGRTVRTPFGSPQIHQIVSQNWFRITPEVRRTLRDRGWRSVGGVRLHEYTFTADSMPVQLYAGTNDLPVRSYVRMTRGTVTILYSRYNAPISINP